jgi:hypothetical protein
MPGLNGPTIRIGAHDYRLTLLQVEVGLPLRWELIGVFGEPLLQSMAGIVEKLEAGKTMGDLNVEDALSKLAGLFKRVDPRFMYKLQETFVGKTEYRGDGGEWTNLARTWQLHFAGNYHELDQLTWAHLRANYLSFLDDSGVWQAMSHAGHQVLSAARSRPTSPSTGTSGESSVASVSQ